MLLLFRDLIDDLDGFSIEPEMMLDVPFVPTDDAVVEAILNLGEVGPKDLLYDLGSGDGRIVITAARDRGTPGIGIEIDPMRISDAMEEAAYARVEFLVNFIEEDLFTADIRPATVVTLYLLESINIMLRPRLLDELRPGTRVISHSFNMGDWKPDQRVELGGIRLYKWIIPAKVEGAWAWDGLDNTHYYVELKQKYQKVSGKVWMGDNKAHLRSTTLMGNTLEVQIQEHKTAPLKTFTLIFENNELQAVEEFS